MKYRRGRPSVWVLTGIIFLAPGLFSRPAFAQGEPQSHAVELLQEIRHDVSPPLREIKPLVRPLGPPEAKEIRLLHPPREVKRMPDAVMQTSTLANISTTAGVNFEGVAANGSAPPDTNGSAGTTQFVEWVNTEFAVYDKTGRLLLGPVQGNTLWSGFGGPCQTNNDGDIVVLFDKLNNRWVMSQLSVTGGPPFFQCVAVSTTADATGSFARYAFQQPNFNDYPKLGVWRDAYYVTYNIFDYITGFFQGARLCAMDAAAMRAGSTATQQCFQLSTSFGAVLPSDVDGTTPPPAGEPAFFLGFDNNLSSLDLWKFHVDFTTPANSTLTGPASLAVTPFNEACGGGTCVPQSGTTQQLDSLADRVMYRLAYRNFGSHESLVVNHSITAGSGVGARWYEIQNPAANPVVFQSGTFAPDSSYRWMGSIAMDKAGDIALGYSVSSSSLHPAIRYTGRVPSDPLGTMETETSIIEGPGSQTGGLTRWGDYSSMSVDPVDDCTFWYSSEYQPSNGAFNWHTRIASFKFPGCGGPDFSTSASPSSQTVVAGNSTPYTVNVGALNGFSGTVTFSTSGLPSGAGASFNPTSIAGSGSSTMTVTTSASTAAGTYTITITGTSGTVSHSTTVSLTVNAAAQPNFSLSASPGSVTVTQGSSGASTIAVTPQNGFNGTVTFGTSGLPSNASASFNPTSVTGSGNSTMTVTTSASTPAGTYTITVTGTSGSLSHTTTVSLTVSAAGQQNYSLSASPSSVTVTQGTSGTSTITVTPQNGFGGTVGLSASGLPSGVTAAFNPSSTTSTSTLTLTASSTATTGSATVTITGTSSGLTHTTTIALSVTPGPNFSLSASPNSLTVARGSTGTSTITISPTNNFNGSVSFSASNLPIGVTASFNPSSSTSASTLTLTVGSSATTGTFSVRVRGRSGSLSHSVRINLTVQ
ncbi:MAG TPA: hypothetical protein VMO76_07045 [Candidatus Udaeobacter sp.]|nr:hypothetical protein [Candidatus Udaeobacter sp.]